MKYVFTASIAIVAVILLAGPATADPLRGEVLKFQQRPMDGLVITGPLGVLGPYWGHDELSTAGAVLDPGTNELGFIGDFMADDFSDTNPNPVVHVKWWGSYLDGVGEPGAANGGGVRRFLISFEADIPAVIDPDTGIELQPSSPGTPLLSQVVTRGPLAPGSGTFTEKKISGGGDPLFESLYEYNGELACKFPQEPDTVYWLKIVALDDIDPGSTVPNIQWGWHNRDYTVTDPLASTAIKPGERVVGSIPSPDGAPIWHHQDDAVNGFVGIFPNLDGDPNNPCDDWLVNQDVFGPAHYLDGADGPTGISRYSKDLAFELYSVPEPGTVAMLIGAGLMGLLAYTRRRKKA